MKEADIATIEHKNDRLRLIVISYFIIYFIVGLCIYKDYGFSTDESAEWEESIVAYKYINSRIFHREVPELAKVADMEEFDHRYYGTAMQMPMVLIEDLTDFTLTTQQIFYMRHLMTFLTCFIGYICFYFALKRIFGDRLSALAGVMIVSLYPRLFGYQFTDLKNLIFLALNMMVFLSMVYAVEKENVLTMFLFGCLTALASNQRIMAVVYPIVLLGYWLVRDITDKVKGREKSGKGKRFLFGKYPFVAALYLGVWFLISPFAWLENPFQAFINTLKEFSQYSWYGTMVFMGKIITCEERPWYYLPVWFALTIPIIYLVLFLAGNLALFCLLKKEENKWESLIGKYKWLACSILLFWGCVGAVIILDSRIYVGWHHMFFVFMPFAVIVVYGLKFAAQFINKKIVGGVFSLCLVYLVGWMIVDHPFQVVYFNPVGRQYAALFDRDEQRATSSVLLDWVLDNTEGTVSVCGETDSRLILSEEEKARIKVADEEEGEYLIDIFRNVVGNYPVHEGYEEVYVSWVDGYKIGAVFRRTE